MNGFPPEIPLDALPRKEREHAEFVGYHLFYLGKRCEELAAAIMLFDFVVGRGIKRATPEGIPRRVRREWVFIAAREAATAVYRFKEDMEWLAHNLDNCPALQKMIDAGARRAATRLFSGLFPEHDALRHSSQHMAKIYGTPERKKRHEGKPFLLLNNLTGDAYQTDLNGKTVTLRINEATLKKLNRVKEAYWDAFWPLDPKGHQVHLAALARAARQAED